MISSCLMKDITMLYAIHISLFFSHFRFLFC